jgi:hypothetical protein
MRAWGLPQPPERLDSEFFRAATIADDSDNQPRDVRVVLGEDCAEVEDGGRRRILGDDDVARGLHDLITRRALIL